jgi:ribosomal protein S18 acetylase RimI-like enzyme
MPLCRFLEFDSELFGMRLARLNADKLTESVCALALEWCKENRITGLYALVDSSDSCSGLVAQNCHYNFVDTRITLTRTTLMPTESSCNVRPASAEDIPMLCRIAAVSHTHTRFYFDHHFIPECTAKLYQIWIKKSCDGWVNQDGQLNQVLVTHQIPTGYITCYIDNGVGHIGLMAVDPAHSGRGIGTTLVTEALKWFGRQRVNEVSVVTQARNIPALRLYQRCGFQITSVQTWYHLWL